MLRNDAGKICGSKVATMLYRYATPVPIAISVNMLVLRFTTDAQPRWKNGQPHQRTTGVARISSNHGSHPARYTVSPLTEASPMNACRHNILPMALARNGVVSP